MFAILLLSLGADISGGNGIPTPAECNCGGSRVMCSCADCKCAVTYADFRSRVEKLQPGETLTLTVGCDYPGATRCDDSKAVGIANGVYSCWYDGTQAKMRRIAQPTTINANVPNNALGTSPSVGQILQLGSPCANGRCPTPPRSR